MAILIARPNGPLAIALTLFPTTAFITITMRWAFAVVPFWQLALSWLLLVATATLSIWAAARIFRMGMLRYGQRLSFDSVVAAVRGISR